MQANSPRFLVMRGLIRAIRSARGPAARPSLAYSFCEFRGDLANYRVRLTMDQLQKPKRCARGGACALLPTPRRGDRHIQDCSENRLADAELRPNGRDVARTKSRGWPRQLKRRGSHGELAFALERFPMLAQPCEKRVRIEDDFPARFSFLRRTLF